MLQVRRETCSELAAHYQTATLPPPLRAKDNTKAEAAVLVVERWIPARLRHQTLFSPGELNSVIKDLLPALNQRR